MAKRHRSQHGHQEGDYIDENENEKDEKQLEQERLKRVNQSESDLAERQRDIKNQQQKGE